MHNLCLVLAVVVAAVLLILITYHVQRLQTTSKNLLKQHTKQLISKKKGFSLNSYSKNPHNPNSSNSPTYLQIGDVRPGQLRYSMLNVQDKVNALVTKGIVIYNAETKEYRLNPAKAYNNNTSPFAITNSFPVVLGPNNSKYLVDGHHDVLSAIYVNATTVPFFIKEDLSHLSCSDFYRVAIQQNYIYPFETTGSFRCLPPNFSKKSFTQMEDDPNRYFAAISARKCESESTTNEDSTGAKYPLWIKVGKDIPFIEFMISTVLYKNNLSYKNEWGKNVPDKFLEEARTVLINQPISGLCLLKKRIYYDDIPNLCSYCPEKKNRIVSSLFPSDPQPENCKCQ